MSSDTPTLVTTSVEETLVSIEGERTQIVVLQGTVEILEIGDDSTLVEIGVEETLVSIEGGGATEVVVLHETVEILELAAQGPAGPTGAAGPTGTAGAGVIEIPFAFGDATPKTLLTAPADKLVYGAGLHIHTAFNGTGAALSIGDGADPARLMAPSANAASEVASYVTSPNHRYGVPTPLILTITPGGGATQGAGIVTLQVEQ